ncbi:MAG: hypothetical protein AAF725_05405 [Acidobacteriota bacterium]
MSAARAFAAVMRRELSEKRLVPAAAAVLGLFPLLAPALPGAGAFQPDQVREGALPVVCLLVALTWPIGLGISLTGRDTSAHRLGFYLSRPVSAWTLWLGKVAAAALLLASSALLVLAPSALLWLSNGPQETELVSFEIGTLQLDPPPLLAVPEAAVMSESLPERPLWWLLVFLVFRGLLPLLAVDAAARIARARGPLIALDLVALAAVAGMTWWIRDLGLSNQAYEILRRVESLLIPGAVLVLIAAGGLAISVARRDVRRGRRLLSLVLWPGLLALTLVAALYVRWAVAPGFDDLERIHEAIRDSSGRHLVVRGEARGRGRMTFAFWMDLEGERRGFLGPVPSNLEAFRFSDDASTLVWPRCRRLIPFRCETLTLDLESGAQRLAGLPITNPAATFADLSAQGDRVLLLGHDRARVHSLRGEGRLEGALTQPFLEGGLFLSSSRAVLLSSGDSGGRLLEWDVAEASTRTQMEFISKAYWWNFRLDPDRRFLLIRRAEVPRNLVLDAASGEILVELDSKVQQLDGTLGRTFFLADGRLVLALYDRPETTDEQPQRAMLPAKVTLAVVDPLDPSSWRTLTVDGGVQWLEIGPEYEPGRVLIGQVRHRDAPTAASGGLQLRDLGLGLEGDATRSTWILGGLGARGAENGPLTLEPLVGGMLPLTRYGRADFVKPGSDLQVFDAGKGELVVWRPGADAPEERWRPLLEGRGGAR